MRHRPGRQPLPRGHHAAHGVGKMGEGAVHGCDIEINEQVKTLFYIYIYVYLYTTLVVHQVTFASSWTALRFGTASVEFTIVVTTTTTMMMMNIMMKTVLLTLCIWTLRSATPSLTFPRADRWRERWSLRSETGEASAKTRKEARKKKRDQQSHD